MTSWLWLKMAVVVATTAAVTSERRYRAAVYEHAVYLPLPPASSRPDALKQMEKNLAVYRQQTAAAKQQGADMVVFPEDGLYGMLLSRRAIRPFLETVPDPRARGVNPCLEKKPDTEVQTALSCMARANSIHLVANMGDRHPCNKTLNSTCPADGQFQFNTGVAFGPDGTLLARYHKINLYAESQFDTPPPDPYNDAVTFNTSLGIRFGLATCFDLLFQKPAVDLVEKHGVRDLAFPTAWMDALPLLPALGFHSAFARGLGVTVLAANLHLPVAHMHGSGVYTAKGAAAFYYDDGLLSPGRLVVADVLQDGSVRLLPPPRFPEALHGQQTSRGESPLPQNGGAAPQKKSGGFPRGEDDDVEGSFTTGIDAPVTRTRGVQIMSSEGSAGAKMSRVSLPKNSRRSQSLPYLLRRKKWKRNFSLTRRTKWQAFKFAVGKEGRNKYDLMETARRLKKVSHFRNPPFYLSDNFTFVPLISTSGHEEVCRQKFCCSVDFEFAEEFGDTLVSSMNEMHFSSPSNKATYTSKSERKWKENSVLNREEEQGSASAWRREHVRGSVFALPTRHEIRDAQAQGFKHEHLNLRQRSSASLQLRTSASSGPGLDLGPGSEPVGRQLYALGVFAGYEGDLGTQRYVQACLVTKCPGSTLDTCGQPVRTASSRMARLRLRGNFTTRYVYPEVLVEQGGQLSPAPGLWDFTSGAIVGRAGLSESPLLATALYGRLYDRDRPLPHGSLHTPQW